MKSEHSPEFSLSVDVSKLVLAVVEEATREVKTKAIAAALKAHGRQPEDGEDLSRYLPVAKRAYVEAFQKKLVEERAELLEASRDREEAHKSKLLETVQELAHLIDCEQRYREKLRGSLAYIAAEASMTNLTSETEK